MGAPDHSDSYRGNPGQGYISSRVKITPHIPFHTKEMNQPETPAYKRRSPHTQITFVYSVRYITTPQFWYSQRDLCPVWSHSPNVIFVLMISIIICIWRHLPTRGDYFIQRYMALVCSMSDTSLLRNFNTRRAIWVLCEPIYQMSSLCLWSPFSNMSVSYCEWKVVRKSCAA